MSFSQYDLSNANRIFTLDLILSIRLDSIVEGGQGLWAPHNNRVPSTEIFNDGERKKNFNKKKPITILYFLYKYQIPLQLYSTQSTHNPTPINMTKMFHSKSLLVKGTPPVLTARLTSRTAGYLTRTSGIFSRLLSLKSAKATLKRLANQRYLAK